MSFFHPSLYFFTFNIWHVLLVVCMGQRTMEIYAIPCIESCSAMALRKWKRIQGVDGMGSCMKLVESLEDSTPGNLNFVNFVNSFWFATRLRSWRRTRRKWLWISAKTSRSSDPAGCRHVSFWSVCSDVIHLLHPLYGNSSYCLDNIPVFDIWNILPRSSWISCQDLRKILNSWISWKDLRFYLGILNFLERS